MVMFDDFGVGGVVLGVGMVYYGGRLLYGSFFFVW